MRAINALRSVRVNFHRIWMRDAFEVALEIRQPLGERLQTWKALSQHLALHDREADLDLVEPTGVDRQRTAPT
ncbi:hypothetical protein [Variovorax defluvii]|uniref:hypothetical protein n=1 Tax=Variovorax defluvii TaxID=913761 RepID=UPI0031E74DF2